MVNLIVTQAKSFKEQLLGLIGKANPENMLFITSFGIHTFGLKFPIDVLVLDKNNNVVKVKKNLKPNRIFVWNIKYNKVIEMTYGQVDKKSIKLGQKIKLNIVNR